MASSARLLARARFLVVAVVVLALCAVSAPAGAAAPSNETDGRGADGVEHRDQRQKRHQKRKKRRRAKRTRARAQFNITTQSPANGQTVSGAITWQVTVSGTTPKRVDFAVDGGVRWSQAASPYVYGGTGGSLDTTTLSDGAHTLTATAYGPKGSKRTSQLTVTVANAAPAPPPASAPPPSDDPPPPPSSGTPDSLYWGATIGSHLTGTQAPWDMNAVSQFEGMTGKPLSLVQFFAPFANCASSPCSYYNFPTTPMENVRQHGAIPFFSWSSASIPSSINQPNFQLSDVIAGTYDSYIQNFATAAKNWGHPFFLRFNWEMNGSWFSWSEKTNGNQPGQYVAAWRHVHDIFTSVGANNATWTWCPNVDFSNSLQSMSSLYPGDAYVDWTCLDGYNWGTNPNDPKGWMSFDQLYKSSYDQIVNTIAPGKPMVIGEIAASEYGGSKSAWIQDMLGKLPTNYPKIRGMLWFEKLDSSMDWPLTTSSSATSAFASGIQNPAYTTNSYRDLPPSPIQPPS
jgi:hypothetical protein